MNFKTLKGVSYRELTLDAAKDGVKIATAMASRFINKKGKLLTDDQAKDAFGVTSINRESNKKHVHKLMTLMLRGVNVPQGWQEKGSEEIVVTVKGYVKDGRHRLRAFIDAAKVNPNLKITFVVKDGVPDDEAAAININRQTQTLRDIATANGHTKFNASVAKLISNRGLSSIRALPDEDVLAMMDKWDASIVLVKPYLSEPNGDPKPKVGTTQVVAAVTRAYMCSTPEQKAAILRFCEVLGGEMPDNKHPEECHPFALSKEFLKKDCSRKCTEVKRDYDLTEFALQMFLEKAEKCELKPARKELFPLPDEAIPVKKGKAAYLIPINARGRSTMEEMAEKAIETGHVFLDSLTFKRIPPRSTVCLYIPRGNKVFASAKSVKIEMVGGSAALKLSNIIKFMGGDTLAEITPAKLMKLSISERGKVPDVAKLAKQATKLFDSDVSTLIAR